MIDRAAIAAARRQLATQPDFLRTTPLMRLSGKSLGVGCAEVWLKLEHLQVGGSFKARGNPALAGSSDRPRKSCAAPR